MKTLFCTGRVPGSTVTDYQCMTSQFTVSRDSGGIVLTCPACKTVHRLETLEAGQRVNVVTDRGIGEESFKAVVEGGKLSAAACAPLRRCRNTQCGDYESLFSENCCISRKATPETCLSFIE